MIARIWGVLADLRLTVAALLELTVLMVVGACYSQWDYAFYESIHNMPLQRWLLDQALSHPGKAWWVVAVLMLFAVLAVNTTACACQRLAELLRRRRSLAPRVLAVALLPSIVHLVFVLVLAANLATFCLGSRQRIPIAANQVVALPSGERLRVAELNLVNYPDASLLAGRVMNGRVQLQSLDRPRQSPAIVRFMRPLYRAGRFLHLDVEQRPDPLTGEKAATMVCNRAEVKNVAHFHAQAYLMITRDPGLFPILAGFAVIVLLMACYYVTGLSRREPV